MPVVKLEFNTDRPHGDVVVTVDGREAKFGEDFSAIQLVIDDKPPYFYLQPPRPKSPTQIRKGQVVTVVSPKDLVIKEE